jgi:Tol biopolymer transport system component
VIGSERFLFFSHFYEGNEQRINLFTMRLDGSGRVNLTHSRMWEIDPALSPGGRRIAFAAIAEPGRDRCTDICVMNADGSHRRRLTNSSPGQAAVSPAWSPDGQQIAFEWWRDLKSDGASQELWVMAADGSDRRCLGEGGAPSWLPAGSCLLHSCWLDEGLSSRSRLFVVNPDGGNRCKLGDRPLTEGVWSPDGECIAGIEVDPGDRKRLVVMGSDGAGSRPLYEASDGDELAAPRWTADGRRLLFTVYGAGDFGPGSATIFRVDVDGQNLERLSGAPSSHVMDATGWGFAFAVWMIVGE